MSGDLSRPKTNILILGETGVGKSTWINSFANYLCFEDLQAATDSNETVAVIPSKFSFTTEYGESKDIIIGAEEGNENFKPGQSATQEPRTHSFSVHNEVINLIDTPGIGDSRGVDQDKKNFESILDHLAYIDEIHAICILLKPNSSRLTVMFRFCIQQLLAHLHKDATRNIVFCFTHARGNFYKPGDTLPTLRQELLERKVDIELKRETVYCFDSEAFRFLACIKSGVEFEPEETEVFAASWTRAVKEKNRLFSHIKSLTPHKVLDTLSMNDTRRLICALSRPLGEMTVTIQKNIRLATEAKEKAKLADLEALDFMKDLHVDGIDLVLKTLGHPRTVCTHNDCIEYIATGRDNIKQVNYKQHCHPRCELSGVPSEAVGDSRLQSCQAMAPKGVTCNVCGHSFNNHMHRTYDLVTISRKFISPAVEMKIQKKKDAKSQLEALEAFYNKLVKEFEYEQGQVFRISAIYGSFLKDVAMIPYNDALGDYLDMNIAQEREKDNILRNQGLIDRLQTSKEEYEEEKKIIEDVMASSVAGATRRFTPSKIKDLQGELFNLKHFGKSLKVIFESIDGSKRNKYDCNQIILVPAPLDG